MTNNRELLELAALAAGYKYTCTQRLAATANCVVSSTIIVIDGNDWNPLEDDGDAFRLAVKLSLEIDLHRTGVAVRTPEGHKILIHADEIKDGYSAARRAIVRAAAEIGRRMKEKKG